MKNQNQTTLGRQQMLLYLAKMNDWVFVADVFGNVKPDGIKTPAGVRKALKELKYVEMENVASSGRPTYKCRLKQDNDTLRALLTMFGVTEHPEEFFQSVYVQNVLGISGLEVYRIIMDLITACMKTVLLTLNTFYPNVEAQDQMSATLMTVDVSDDTANEQFFQKRQEADVLMHTTMENLKQLLPMLSDLPNCYEKAISPDICCDWHCLKP